MKLKVLELELFWQNDLKLLREQQSTEEATMIAVLLVMG